MRALLPHFDLSPEAFWQWGRLVLGGGLAVSVLLVLLMAARAPSLFPAVPVLLVGGATLAYLIRRPLAHLCVVLAGSVAIISYQEGIQWYEAVYGLYYLTYLAGWFIYHTYLCRERIARSAVDWALLAFFAYATATFAFTLLYGGDLRYGFSEWISLTLFGFYFPIKESLRTDGRALRALLVVAGVIVFFILVRNAYLYYTNLNNAEYLWQIATGRVRMNERFLMVGALGFFILFLYRHSKLHRLGALLAASLLVGGVIIGQSRAVWLSLLFGLGVLFVLTDRKRRLQLTALGTAGLLMLVVVGFVLLDDFFVIILTGLVDRFSSLGSAFTEDISLVNRFVEWQAVWEYIKENPLLGHGFGTEFEFYNLIYYYTEQKSHIHNTYISLWYKHGLVGLGLALFVFMHSYRDGLEVLRQATPASLAHVSALTCLAALPALALAAVTESILTVNDGVLIVVFPTAILAGLWQAQHTSPPNPAPPFR